MDVLAKHVLNNIILGFGYSFVFVVTAYFLAIPAKFFFNLVFRHSNP